MIMRFYALTFMTFMTAGDAMAAIWWTCHLNGHTQFAGRPDAPWEHEAWPKQESLEVAIIRLGDPDPSSYTILPNRRAEMETINRLILFEKGRGIAMYLDATPGIATATWTLFLKEKIAVKTLVYVHTISGEAIVSTTFWSCVETPDEVIKKKKKGKK